MLLSLIINTLNVHTNINSIDISQNEMSINIPFENVKSISSWLPEYLPPNIKEEDEQKIKLFIIEASRNYDNDFLQYKIDFIIKTDGIHLKDITLYNSSEFITEQIILKEVSNTDSIVVFSRENGFHDIRNKLPHFIVEKIHELISTIESHYSEFSRNNAKYEIILSQLKGRGHVQVIGIRVSSNDGTHIFYILNTPRNTKSIIVNDKYEVLGEIAIGLNNNVPVIDCHRKLGSGFGMRKDPILKRARRNKKKYRHHSGQDIVVPMNSFILSISNGIVVDCGYNSTYGYFIVVHHGQTTRDGYSSLYAHLSKINVKLGDVVTSHQIIGLSGSTGSSTGPHLHFELIRNDMGQRINPLDPVVQSIHLPIFLKNILKDIIVSVDKTFDMKYDVKF